jgi:hypothetical protein
VQDFQPLVKSEVLNRKLHNIDKGLRSGLVNTSTTRSGLIASHSITISTRRRI